MPNQILEYCILNVAADPHPRGVYFGLLEKAAGKPVTVAGPLMAAIRRPGEVAPGLFMGELFIWTHIDLTEPGVDIAKLEPIQDLRKYGVDLPSGIGYNGRIFLYVLREEDHKLFVESRNEFGKRLSPERSRKIFQSLFNEATARDPVSQVEVTLVPSEDVLNRILTMSRLKRLEIHLVRPNPDDSYDEAEEIVRKLREQRAKSLNVVLVEAPKSGGIKPNKETVAQAKVAETNGYVKGVGEDAHGERQLLSTKEHPRIERIAVSESGTVRETAVRVARRAVIRNA